MHKLICYIFVFISPFLRAEIGAQELDKLVFQWSKLEQQHSEIDNRWREKKPLIEQQLRLLKEEKLQLQTLLDGHVYASSDVKKKRFDLLAEQTKMEQLQELMKADLMKISATVLAMHNRLPPPIKEKWNSNIALLTGANTVESSGLLTNSERLEKLLMMLENIERFEERPALHQTSMKVKKIRGINNKNQDDSVMEIQVDQVYLGVSQGWYLSKNSQYWGFGNSTPTGWQWSHQSSEVSVDELRKTVKMLKEPATATIVTLPVKLSMHNLINVEEM
ncbi:MAG: DUF3450 family protein [Colwellia sp.]|nr:DUF3450 family protein [Colwellia sp.]